MQILESLAYTLNHIYLEDRKVSTYEMPESDNNLMAAGGPNPLHMNTENRNIHRIFLIVCHMTVYQCHS